MQTNVVSLTREDTGIAIPAENLQLSIDANSWDWAWSANVPADCRPLLMSAYGSAVILLATINGMPFRLAVERFPRQREYPRSTMSVSGRSRAILLDAPYADVVTRSASTSATAQQLMAAALTDNGAALGWDIDWQITDWVVPADVWSHTGTAIDACQTIAAAAGGYIQAHPSEQVLSVLARYPVAPWNWSSLAPDVEIPEAVCVVESDDIVDKPDYNTVFVSGRQGGILAHVTRGGSAGDRAAQMVTDALITHSEAGRQRGMSILGDTGRQRDLGISMPVLDGVGIILPGTFVRYTTTEGIKIGLTRGVSIDAARPTVRQTIKMEVHDDV